MSTTVRGNLVFAWLGVISLAVVCMAWGQAAQEPKVTDFDELNVHRINIVEPDGKPRVIISNRKSMPGVYWQGKEHLHANRDEGGFLFFNDAGTEVGGMTFKSHKQGDEYGAQSSLLFDHYNQQEALGLTYGEENGHRAAGLHVWNQPTESIFPAIELQEKLKMAKTDAEREPLRAQLGLMSESMRAQGAFAERLFAGKDGDVSLVKLADKKGKVRLLLQVDGAGEPSIEFLDESGKIVRRIPEK